MASFKKITVDQMNQTQKKIRNNISSMLDFLDKCLGKPDNPNQEISEIYINEMYSIFANAVEEYGKLVYMKSLIQDSDNNYEVNYRHKFRDHTTKSHLALTDLPKSISDVFEEGFTKMPMNVLNVDLDDKGNPTWITFDLDMDTLRKCVYDFRSQLT
jgi:hypothetical protein